MKWFNSAFSISNKHRHNRLHLLSEFSRREKKQGVLHLNDIPAGTRSSDCNQNSLRRKTSGTVKPKPLESWISERWSSDESPVCDKSDRSGTGFIWEAEKTLSLWWLKTTQQFEVWLYYNSAAKGLVAISAALCRIKEPLTVAATLDGLPSFIMIKKLIALILSTFVGHSNLFSRTQVTSFCRSFPILLRVCVCLQVCCEV